MCRAGDQRFAVPVTQVREVVALPPLTRIPGAPASVRGLANVHGILVTVLSGSGAGLVPDGPDEWLVVLTTRQGQLGLAVDDVEDLAVSDESSARVVNIEDLIRTAMGG